MFLINSNTYVLRIPKPNAAVIILALIALITILQTVQLLGISTKAASVKAVTVPQGSSGTGAGTGGAGSDVPESMVGGC